MPLSWNEIRHNAIRFAKEWAGETREDAEAKSFWDEFFRVFGTRRRLYATFEEPVRNLGGDYSYIDLFWRGVLIVEHKSFGKSLSKAESQAQRYIQDLAREGREKEIPRYLIVSDFARVALHDLEEGESVTFPLAEFHRHIHAFAFIPGYKQHKFEAQDPINIQAVEILGDLHDALEAGGYIGHDLERFLVRILFCLFAEDTGIFEREAFRLYLENRTAEDGSDLGPRLAQLFAVLNTPVERRQKNLDEELQAFPYVNGELFHEQLGFAEFNRDMRNALLACTRFDWSRISPAIFGSLFQAVMEPKERRQVGGHYTAEHNILKVIRSLFLDALRAEFDAIQADRSTRRRARLEEFHAKLCRLKFLDPACGCGNFLVITYRELRRLELEVLRELFGGQREMTLDDINRLSQVDVDQFFGIEIGEWPARIAEVALWLMDHQMNLAVSEAFGQLYRRLPLKKSPRIVCANALRMDWKELLPPDQCSYILGNPPWGGSKLLSKEQKADMDRVFRSGKAAGTIDHVGAWFRLAAEYCHASPAVRCALVSTNSITQGEQVAALWPELLQLGVVIHFAHRTFAWESEARGKAHVHCVIIGFGVQESHRKTIFDYISPRSEPQVAKVSQINPYLIEYRNVIVTPRMKPLCDVPPMSNGSIPADGGNLVMTVTERDELLAKEPEAARWIRPYLGADGLINGEVRYCLWLGSCPPEALRRMTAVLDRVERVRVFRLASTKDATRRKASTPSLFTENRQPLAGIYLAVPRTSSQNRRYVPITMLPADVVAANDIQLVEKSSAFEFGVLTSAMHMAWMATLTGRLKSDYRYSNKIVYNNYPWPEAVTEKQRAAVEHAAQCVLDVRAEFLAPVAADVSRLQSIPPAPEECQSGLTSAATPPKTATLADLYDPLAMPPELQQAHEALDRAVDKCYRPEPFTSERQRVEFLFALYETLAAPLVAAAKPKRSARRKSPYADPPSRPAHPSLNPEQAHADAAHFYSVKEEAPPFPP